MQIINTVFRDSLCLYDMTERNDSLSRIKRHIIISHNIQNLQTQNPVHLNPIADDLSFVNFDFSLTVADLQNFSLCFTNRHTVRQTTS